MGTISDKLTYLDETRENIRQSINSIGGNLTNSDTFRSYSDAIDEIYEKFPKVEGEGSNITLENTMEASIKSELNGDTSQEGTPTPDSPQPVNVVSGLQEIDIVGKNFFNKNTAIRNKTFTSQNVVSDSTGLFISDYIKVKPNTTYYTNEYATVVIGLDKNKSPLGYIRNVSVAGTFTTGTTCEYIRIRSYNTTIDMETAISKAMVNEGTTATTYEEYKGQSYEINLGKNIVPTPDKTETTINGLTYSISNGVLTINGTATANTTISIATGLNIDIPDRTQYIISVNKEGTTTATGSNLQYLLRNSSNSILGYVNNIASNTQAINNFQANGTINNIIFVVVSGVSLTNATFTFQVEKGQATSYSPYKTPIEVCNINDYKDMIFRSEGKNLWDEEYVGMQNDLIYKAIYVGDGTFTLSTTMPKTTSNFTNLFFLAGNVSTGASTQNNGVSYGTPRTQQSINGYITIAYRNSENLSPVDYATMLNEGNTPLPYEPYNSKGKWLLHKEIGRVVLDGSEKWNVQATDTNFTTFHRADILTDEAKANNFQQGLCLSNHFKTAINWNIWTNTDVGIDAYVKRVILTTPSSIATTEATLNQWLQANKVELYYVLATPTTTEITDSELIEQLAEFGDAKSYEGTTNINVDGDLPTILNVKALEDIFSQ